MDPDDPHEYNATDPTEDDCEVYFRDREYWGVMESCRGLDGEPAWKVTDVGVHIFAD